MERGFMERFMYDVGKEIAATPCKETSGWREIDTSKPSIVKELKTYDIVMSNFDHSIKPGAEDRLRQGDVCGSHAGWNFMGYICFRDELFWEEVWQYNERVALAFAPSLRELMDLVNDRFGEE